MSGVRCQVSGGTIFYFLFIFDKMVELVGEGLLSTGPSRSSLVITCLLCTYKSDHDDVCWLGSEELTRRAGRQALLYLPGRAGRSARPRTPKGWTQPVLQLLPSPYSSPSAPTSPLPCSSPASPLHLEPLEGGGGKTRQRSRLVDISEWRKEVMFKSFLPLLPSLD